MALRKTLILYGLGCGLLIILLRVIQYRFILLELSSETYISLLAIIFILFGIWLGNEYRVRGEKKTTANALPPEQPATALSSDSLAAAETFAISRREMEVLLLMAKGLSNQEIAEQLFVSLHTIKKHSSSLFQKLDVKRRTQAIDKAKSAGLIP